jgi:drug/metabolite transporter (DMT)-like permease
MPWQARFLLLALIWGASFMFIKVGLEALSPLQVAFGRIVLGAATLLVLLRAAGERLPRGRAVWGHLFVVALLFNSVPFSLFAFGETHVTSIVAGIWNATTPLMTLLVALAALPDERPTPQRLAGLGVGFAGVLVVLGPWAGLGGPSLLGNLACLGAAACYGLGFGYVTRAIAGRPLSATSLSAAQLLCATVQTGVLMPFTDAPGGMSAKVVLAMLGLGALGTGLAYILNYDVVRAAGPTVASTVTYAVPLFSTLFGVSLLGEPLTWNEPAGAAIVVLGIVLSRRAPQRVAVAAAG